MRIKPAAFAVVLLLLLCLTACTDAPKGHLVAGKVLSGSDASAIRIEVFSDMQCPACRSLFIETLQPLMEDYEDRVSVVYYDFPLSSHKYAYPAAQYTAAATKLGRQQMLSVFKALYNDQSNWARDGNLEDTVSKALSAEDFQRVRQILRDSDSLAEINETIAKELQLGRQKDIRSTPTLFISNSGREQRVEGRLPYLALKQFLR